MEGSEISKTHPSSELYLDKNLAKFISTSYDRFCQSPDIRIIHVTKKESLPKKGIVSSSAILLGEPSTGIFFKDNEPRNEEWRTGLVFIPLSPDFGVKFFAGDVRSTRTYSGRRIPTKEFNLQEGKYIKLNREELVKLERNSIIDTVLDTQGGYNEIWVDITKVLPIKVKLRQQPNGIVQIDYRHNSTIE